MDHRCVLKTINKVSKNKTNFRFTSGRDEHLSESLKRLFFFFYTFFYTNMYSGNIHLSGRF